MRRLLSLAVLVIAVPLAAQQATPPDSGLLTVERIFSGEFRSDFFGPMRWLGNGTAYTTLERTTDSAATGRDLVRYDAATGARTVLVASARLVPAGAAQPLGVEEYTWSDDGTKLLIFTNSEQVWRQNTRGDFWVLDLSTWQLKKLGGNGPASTLMFAKFSPDGGRVGYVRYGEYNVYVENLGTGDITRITSDGSRTTINGTFDWVYEEELDLRDGWRWSPDGQRIAYWQLDATGVRDFALINDTDSLYSFTTPVQYPKAGATNSAGRVGVVSAAGGETKWLSVPGDPRNNYVARMEWAGNSTELVIQHLNRLQNTNHVMFADAATGAVRTVLTEQDTTGWVELVDPLTFVNRGQDFVWLSDRSGWTHLYLVSRDGRQVRPITRGSWDVLAYYGVDAAGQWVYFVASPDNPAQRYLYRARLSGRGNPERLTPPGTGGANSYNVAPGFRFAVHNFSNLRSPTMSQLVELPRHRVVRTLVENARLRSRVATLRLGQSEFVSLDGGNGVRFNAWIVKPVDFDSTKRYPVLFYVYGGPGSQTVMDSWGGTRYLWHQMLAQRGYIVASVDNRGTGARGSAWRKITYGRLGVVETEDQAAAARALARLRYVDGSRIGIWGWSYGGFMSLNAILQFPDVYKTAVAVAPVTHWKFYDTIYTERYNGLPQDNASGYDQGSPLTYARNLRGNLLIIHGSGDDNVHYQNTETLVNALVSANKPFQLMVYPNRNHGIGTGGATVHLYNLMTRYILEKL
jgi:dipeptidyl-peptidase 4